jgi:hypothetical protein
MFDFVRNNRSFLFDVGVAVTFGEDDLPIFDYSNDRAGNVQLRHLPSEDGIEESFQIRRVH